MPELENKADVKETEAVYKNSSEIAMAGLVEALNKCDDDYYARCSILEAMQQISENEEKRTTHFVNDPINVAGYISDNWGLYLCAFLGGKAIVKKTVRWFRNRKK